jgi:hypothetical protein
MACNISPQQVPRRFAAPIHPRRFAPDGNVPISAWSRGSRQMLTEHIESVIAAVKGMLFMRKTLPDTMFRDAEQSRLTMLRSWVLDYEVTEIQMNERQFWNFANLQPVAEKPWVTFMGRVICVPDMPIDAQKHLGIFDNRSPGAI